VAENLAWDHPFESGKKCLFLSGGTWEKKRSPDREDQHYERGAERRALVFLWVFLVAGMWGVDGALLESHQKRQISFHGNMVLLRKWGGGSFGQKKKWCG